MTALIVLGCILLFFVFLFSLKATITIAYAEEVTLSVKVLFLKIPILPKKEKRGKRSMSAKQASRLRKKMAKKAAKKRESAKAKEQAKAEKKEQSKDKPKKTIGEILDVITMVRRLAGEVIRRFFGHLRIDVARLRIKIATPDAATTAIAYGAVTQAVNLLFPVLEQVKTFSLPDATELDIQADFLSESPEIDVKISFSLRVWHLFHVALGALKHLIKYLLQTKLRAENSRKE